MEVVFIEKFKEIDDFKRYQISNLGRIKTIKGKFRVVNNAYYIDSKKEKRKKRQQITFKEGSKSYTVTVHRLVIKAFGEPQPTKKHTVDHIDRDPFNNNIGNLRWATPKEQVENRGIVGVDSMGIRVGNKINKKDFSEVKISKEKLDLMYYATKDFSLDEVSEKFNIHRRVLFIILKYIHPLY